ncbi:MAG: Ku protein [Labilithrix sp.]|nr:Ku protein [Labilithrix sp.]MCW5813899.1 Ku protein [Labilithrix sp.]
MAARRAAPKKKTNDETDEKASPGAGRSIWTGSISFGLLQIPVSLYTAESRQESLHFRMLDKKDLAPIRFERVSSSTGKPVAWKDIVKGFEIEKDSYVVVEPEDFAKANVKATQTIDIQDFVPVDRIDPVYFETPYYVVPQKRAAKAYVLLREALQKKNAAAIATFVLRTRAHLVAVMPAGDALLLEVLRFGHELKDVNDMPLPSKTDEEAITAREVAMASLLIDGMMTDWDPKKYKDAYYRDVMKIIEEKAKKGEAKERHAKVTGTVAHDVVDLLDLLKKSVGSGAAANDARTRPRKATAKRATRRKKAA